MGDQSPGAPGGPGPSPPWLPSETSGLRVGRHFTIPASELQWRFSGSGGPGGQHANTANTRVELIFDISTSGGPGPRQRARLLERLGPVVRVVASDERSQFRNRELAQARLTARLVDALHQERPRVGTVPTVASRARRRRDKEARSTKKRDRRPPLVQGE